MSTTTKMKVWTMVKSTYKNWMANSPFQLSAAVSYYALFSFPALLIIVIRTAGVFYDKGKIKGKIINEIGNVLGSDSAETIETLIKNAANDDQSTFAIIIGIATLLYGATGLFISLQKALNDIWGVKIKSNSGILKMIMDRAFSLSIVLMIGFLLLVSLALTAILGVISDWLLEYLSVVWLFAIRIINILVSLSLVTVLFAMIFKILPDVKIAWKNVWTGVFVTSILFTLGKFLLGIYFSNMNPASTFGAAGSIVLILLWVSYSCLILFFGAEFTKVYAERFGDGIKPTSYAEVV